MRAAPASRLRHRLARLARALADWIEPGSGRGGEASEARPDGLPEAWVELVRERAPGLLRAPHEGGPPVHRAPERDVPRRDPDGERVWPPRAFAPASAAHEVIR